MIYIQPSLLKQKGYSALAPMIQCTLNESTFSKFSLVLSEHLLFLGRKLRSKLRRNITSFRQWSDMYSFLNSILVASLSYAFLQFLTYQVKYIHTQGKLWVLPWLRLPSFKLKKFLAFFSILFFFFFEGSNKPVLISKISLVSAMIFVMVSQSIVYWIPVYFLTGPHTKWYSILGHEYYLNLFITSKPYLVYFQTVVCKLLNNFQHGFI